MTFNFFGDVIRANITDFCIVDCFCQMLIMKHKKDLISESEKKARGMVDNLSEKLRYLQVIYMCAASKFPFILYAYIVLVG